MIGSKEKDSFTEEVEKQIMGDAKRRKEKMGDRYGQEENIFPWLPITKTQANQFVEWSSRGAWIGIGAMVVLWVTVRFIGPALGLWVLKG